MESWLSKKNLLWLCFTFLVLTVEYIALQWYYEKKNQIPTLPVMHQCPNTIQLWHGKTQQSYFLFYPHQFHPESQKLGNAWLNKQLGKKDFSYYWLQAAHFQPIEKPFTTQRDQIVVTVNKQNITSVLFSDLEKNCSPSIKLWLQTMSNSGKILQEKSKEPITSLFAPKYLVAFPLPVVYEQVEKIKIRWDTEECELSSVTCLRSVLDEYLRTPKPDFWK